MCKLISLKFGWSNFTTPLICLRGAAAMATSMPSNSTVKGLAFSVPGRQNYGSHLAPTPHMLPTVCHIMAVA